MKLMAVKKGQHLRYTGPYAPGVSPYSDGVAVGFRTGRGTKFVIVALDSGDYADWPVDEVELVE